MENMKFLNFHMKEILLALVLVGLTACSTDLKQGLDERQADEILVALRERNIDAKKESRIVNREPSYAVTTSRTTLAEAQRVLVILGLPREKMVGIEDICGKADALIPSPSIDRCKFQLALQNEIKRALVSIDGVVDVKVNVNIPEKIALTDGKAQRPTAAVMLKYIPDEKGQAPFDDKKVREYVANSVDNLDFNDVSLLATPARTFQLAVEGAIKPVSEKKIEEPAPAPKKEQVAKEESASFADENHEDGRFLGIEVPYQSLKKLKVITLVVTVMLFALALGTMAALFQVKTLRQKNARMARKSSGKRATKQIVAPAASPSQALTRAPTTSAVAPAESDFAMAENSPNNPYGVN